MMAFAGGSSYSHATAVYEELESTLQAAPTEHRVVLILVGKQIFMNQTDEYIAVDDTSFDCLSKSVVCKGGKTTIFLTHLNSIKMVYLVVYIICLNLWIYM